MYFKNDDAFGAIIHLALSYNYTRCTDAAKNSAHRTVPEDATKRGLLETLASKLTVLLV